MRLFRFLHNKRVTPAEMAQAALSRTLPRVKGRHVLTVQDTTSLRDASNTTGRSLQLHPTIAINAEDGSLLDLVEARFLTRQGGNGARKAGVLSHARRAADGWTRRSPQQRWPKQAH